jgi:hypothetical protein
MNVDYVIRTDLINQIIYTKGYLNAISSNLTEEQENYIINHMIPFLTILQKKISDKA